MTQTPLRHLTVEDLWRLPRPGLPAVAPDGAFVVYAVTSFDMESNESETRLYRLDRAGAEPVAVTAKGVKSSQPAVSPDGTRLAFVRPDADKRGQLAVMRLDGGEAEIVTDLPLGLTDPRWFPDGKRIAFLAQVYKDALTLDAARERRDAHEKDKVKAYVTEDCISRYWDGWITDGRTYHVFSVDLATRAVVDLTPNFTGWFNPDHPEGCYDISPDGREIAFSADRSEPPHRKLNWDVFTVPATGGEPKNLTREFPGHENRPRYSPDGAHILYGMQRMPEFYADRVRLVLFDRKTGKHEVLTEAWDRSAANWEFAPGGKQIWFTTEDKGAHAVCRAKPAPGEPEMLHRGGTLAAGIAVAPSGVFAVWDNLSTPPEVVHMDAQGERMAWTALHHELLAGITLGAVRETTVPGANGKPCQYYEILPPGFTPERKWPLIMAVHGGPHGIWSDNFHFRWNMHLFAARGYVVVAPNPHGSTSFGQEYCDEIQGGWGDKPYRDVMAVTDALAKSGYVDAARMAAVGGSYGGYMMAWIAGQTGRFACLVNHAGCSNTLSMYASDIVDDWGRAMGGEPWEGIENIDRMNPIRHASGFQSPMLVIHGEKDYRVPVTQGLEIYNVYCMKGVPARLVVFPDENHWVLKPQSGRLWYGEVEAWLEKWIDKGPTA